MLSVVTGGLSYIGKYITKRLVARDDQVRILTGHPDRPNPFGDRVTIAPFCFEDEPRLVSVLSGATTLFNTYWVRFDRGTVSFDKAIEHTRRLVRAAETVGIQRIVHLSVSNPSADSPFPYFRGKAVLEKIIAESKLSYAIIRPTLVYGGPEEMLVNNIAWLLRRFPVFAIPKPGSYRLQPIHVDEVADLAVQLARESNNVIVDAAGPDKLTFGEMVRLIKHKIGSHAMLFKASPTVALSLLKIVGLLVRDVVLTRDELGALMAELLASKEPPVGKMRFGGWLDQYAATLGRQYANEMTRHFR
jgi:NADH dehydrogenase